MNSRCCILLLCVVCAACIRAPERIDGVPGSISSWDGLNASAFGEAQFAPSLEALNVRGERFLLVRGVFTPPDNGSSGAGGSGALAFQLAHDLHLPDGRVFCLDKKGEEDACVVACVVGDCLLHDARGASVVGVEMGTLPEAALAHPPKYILVTNEPPFARRMPLKTSVPLSFPLFTDNTSTYDRFGDRLALDPNSTVVLGYDFVKDRAAVYRSIICADIRHPEDNCTDRLEPIEEADPATFHLLPLDPQASYSTPFSMRVAEDRYAYYNFTGITQSWLDRIPKVEEQ